MLKQGDKILYTAQFYTNAETAGNVQDYTVFVPQMITGETAEVTVEYVKNNVAYAKVSRLLNASPERCQPPCTLFGKCGGCTLMHMDYSEQLLFKQNKVRQNLKKIAGLDVEVLPCQPSPSKLCYRNKLSLPVRGKAGNARIGMYRKNSHFVVDADNCLLGGEWCKSLVAAFRKYVNDFEIPPYDERTFAGVVRHLVARYVDGQLLVTVVANGEFKYDWQPLISELEKSFNHFGLFVNVNTAKNNVILGADTRHVYGLKYIEGEHLGVKFRLRPDSFFQVNDGVKDGIYLQVKNLLDVSKTQVLAECFSGIGILTDVLASDNYITYAVEIEKSAVSDALELHKLNGRKNIINVCGDVAEELPKITAENVGKVLSLVADPPRKGLGAKICDTILQASFDNIVYVSCDSATLARDLKMLSTRYTVDFVQPWDMFPQTAEVETVVHLGLKGAQFDA